MGKRIDINLDEMRVLYNLGLSDNEIANRLGCSRKSISRRRQELGLPINFWGAIDAKKAEIITRMFSEGKSGGEICRTLHLSSATVAKFKKEHNIQSAFEMKMSAEDIEKAMKMAEKGYMDSEIAEVFGVTASNIQVHRKRRGIKSQFSYDKISKIDKAKFEELFNQGLTDDKIAQELGMSADGIYSHRMRYGYLRKSYAEAKNNPLTQDNLEIILGIMMGDGSMEKNKNARMTIAHCPQQKEYRDYIAQKLSNLNPHLYHAISKPHPKTGKCYESYWIDFPANPAFNIICEHFYVNRIKRIPIELFNNFTWQSLAYLYMDDGSRASCGAQIATNCFSIEDLEKFQIFLKERFNLETTICKSHTLYIKAKSYHLMKSQIEPYMCECMKYKIR